MRAAFELPDDFFAAVSDETLVCRCEEVTAAQVRTTADMGCEGPNQMKAFLRCGMGPCQGRLCGLTVTELIVNKATAKALALTIPPSILLRADHVIE